MVAQFANNWHFKAIYFPEIDILTTGKNCDQRSDTRSYLVLTFVKQTTDLRPCPRFDLRMAPPNTSNELNPPFGPGQGERLWFAGVLS